MLCWGCLKKTTKPTKLSSSKQIYQTKTTKSDKFKLALSLAQLSPSLFFIFTYLDNSLKAVMLFSPLTPNSLTKCMQGQTEGVSVQYLFSFQLNSWVSQKINRIIASNRKQWLKGIILTWKIWNAEKHDWSALEYYFVSTDQKVSWKFF